jgi:gluconate 2-dehydrogenase
MSKPAVLVARAVFPDLLERLRAWFDVEDNVEDRPFTRDELIERLRGKAGVITTGSERIDAEVLDANPQLRAVCNMAVGFNNLDVDACSARGVLCTNTPDVLTETTADFGFALLLAAARRLGEGERYLRDGRWAKWSYDLMLGAEVHGTTIGVFGMGRIGQAIARRAHHGFGMPVIYFNRSRLSRETEAALGARHVDKPTLLREADHLVIVAPYTVETHHAIGAPELAQMKPGATLVNIARGGVVDDAALAAALRDGPLGAAGLDVFEGEPALNPALLQCPNAVLTPHNASASAVPRRALFELACDNLIAALGCGPHAGRPPTPLNPQVLPLAPPAR